MLQFLPSWRKQFIHLSINDHLRRKEKPQVVHTEYPYFGYPDMFFAIETLYKCCTDRDIRSNYHMDMGMLIDAVGYGTHLRIGVSTTQLWPVDYKEDKFFPTDSFRFCSEEYKGEPVHFVIRLKLNTYTNASVLEVVSSSNEHAEKVVERIKDHAMENSIYRGKQIEVAYTEEVRDAYGDQQSGEKIELKFKDNRVLHEDEIILEDHIKTIIKELLFDFEEVKPLLENYNIKKKRGIIFHGPPGTGKTFTTRYVSGRLTNRTTLICYGKILGRIKVIANIAKLLSPAIVVLEDVDLVFAQRETNWDQNNLSEFMDILDGHADEQDILFILNTNSLSRVEEAIKDRPGRITQCIFMGAPSGDLRERYFRSLLKLHNASMQNLDRLVAATDQCTQAFIKELIVRSIQKQLNVSGQTDGKEIELREDLALEVLQQMKSSGQGSSGILGFSVSADD